jgi:P27 family predicted phage terminase small subunit
MVAGRKPVTAEVRRQRGEPSRPLPVVIGGRVAPDMPHGLTERMKVCWRFIVGDLTKADAIDHADAGIIEAAAVAWARAREARVHVNLEGLVETTPQGRVENRYLAIERASWKEFRALAESLPLSPWGRARLGLKSQAPADQVEHDIGLPPRLRAVGDGD